MSRLIAIRDYFVRRDPDGSRREGYQSATASGRDQLLRFRARQSTWNPLESSQGALSPGLTQALAKFREAVDTHSRAALLHRRFDADNLSSQQRDTTLSISARTDIIVRESDKNLGTTAMSMEWYKAEVLRQMSDHTIYRGVPDRSTEDILSQVLATLGRLLEGKASVLCEHFPDLKAYCLSPPKGNRTWRVARFYILPKFHKSPVVGRPIVASTAWVTTPTSKVLAVVLRDIVARISTWVLRDTKQLIRKLSDIGSVPSGTGFMTADAGSAYTNMDIPTAVRVTRWGCQAAARLDDSLETSFLAVCEDSIAALLSFVLHSNYFVGNDDTLYKQKRGAAMGTPCAPDLANLYFVYGEAPLLLDQVALSRLGDSRPSVHSTLGRGIVFYTRYLDDVLAFCDDKRCCKAIDVYLNQMFEAVSFTAEITDGFVDSPAVFLDVEIYKAAAADGGRTCRLETVLHQKPLNRFLYIPYHSYHPPGMVRGLVRGELIRFARVCSREADFVVRREAFLKHLHARGYPLRRIHEIADSVRYADREQHLRDSEANDGQFICPWVIMSEPLARSLDLRSLKRELCEDLMRVNPEAFRDMRCVTAWRRPSTLSQLMSLSWPR